eukprot:TRINITY_DN10137_c0_g1_i2.p1 TRINITY_DN10137_c0_g1~~TRINITY_DN10137_c0_g1_i2.p1  ORF type:complete len:306 (-),score=91.71 TRINITY_DN10137_c0_g1_i2:1096-1974(-)
MSLIRKAKCIQVPLIITTALTGNVPSKQMNPSVPCTPQEIAKDVKDCADAGSSLFHVHARDPVTELPTHDLDQFKQSCRLIKKATPEVVIQLSTGARAGTLPQDRMNVVGLMPEMASFCTGSNNLANVIYTNEPSFVKGLAEVFMDTGVIPEIECFDAGHLATASHMMSSGLLRDPLHFNFVMNTAGGVAGNIRALNFLVDSVPEGCTWTVTPIGLMQFPLIAAAIGMGGHVRVGLEDNIFMPDGSLATNAEMVEKVVRIAKEIGRDIATPDETRDILQLPKENKDRVLEYI